MILSYDLIFKDIKRIKKENRITNKDIATQLNESVANVGYWMKAVRNGSISLRNLSKLNKGLELAVENKNKEVLV